MCPAKLSLRIDTGGKTIFQDKHKLKQFMAIECFSAWQKLLKGKICTEKKVSFTRILERSHFMKEAKDQARARCLGKNNQSWATEQTRKPPILRGEEQRKTNDPTNQNSN